ncbi:neutral endopeptidase [Clostridium puniceum]|uniref:Neutral endopeptidase n=1 Tax=Clostridium puniceum TaxID=29367 RepID=A0A1S8SZN8_9CLOT|nr:M13 family metallopeptidase [Clostridium puniceum]OOM70705.1 neutral endopeptidase [Clostridium puniceum]
MKNNLLKKITLLTVILILSISVTLNNSVYSSVISSNYSSNSNQIETNEKIRLQDDFYNAINKEWLSNVKLQEGNISYGTFEEVCGKVDNDIYNIITDIQKNKDTYDKNSDEVKVLNLYNNYLNMEKRNELGIKPIEKYVKKINNISNISDLKEILSDSEFSYFQGLINLDVGADYKDSNKNILYITRNNLGLGNSFYYKEYRDKNKDIQKVYIDYLAKLHILYGEDAAEARKNAENFYDIEKSISINIPSYEEEAKDEKRIQKSYNTYTMKQLEKFVPNIEFTKLLSKLEIETPNKIIVENPEVLKLIDSLLIEDNIDSIKRFLKTSVLLSTDNLLTSEHREASNQLRKIFYGVDTIEFNEGCGIKFINGQLNEIVSRIYVNKYFDKASKTDVENISKEIIENFQKRLKNISWMGKVTKNKALNKLKTINVKVGYPDKWNDYSDIKINSYNEGGNLIENVISIYTSQSKKEFSKLNKPVNKSEWNMGACTVNAYYNALNNEIVFPAGILQAPFYDKNVSKEKNLGGIGVIIGHELTHAFDNTGAQFDETGKLKNWWNTNDYKEFTSRSKKVIDYYSQLETSDGKIVDGFLTVGENISDLGGIACVLDIVKKIENPNLKELFENYATIWREVSTKELREYLLKNDPHAPKKIRVNAVLSQFEEFYKTYNIKKGDKMYVNPEDRVGIW